MTTRYHSYRNLGSTRAAWWTKERIAIGLRRFHADFGFCPTSTERYQAHQQHTGIDPRTGQRSNLGWCQKYPSSATVLRKFSSFREAWRYAGFEMDSGYLEWSPIEDWFILESVGILPRTEVAEMIKRTVPAIKRRLYDLGGFTAATRWGVSVSHAAALLGISNAIVARYLLHGEIPYFRGHKCIYVNPADLLKIKEVDWSKTQHPELDAAIRRSLAQRIAKMAKHGRAWREYELYKFQGDLALYCGRVKNLRTPQMLKEPVPERSDSFSVGDWVTTRKTTDIGVAGRLGIIRAIQYSPQAQPRKDGTHRKCWVARLEFPRLKLTPNHKTDRIRYTLPIDALDAAEAPVVTPKPLSTHPEAVRGRKRKPKYMAKRKSRFEEVAPQLT